MNPDTPRQTLRVRTPGGWQAVPISDEAGGLAVYRCVEAPGWIVVHVASGLRVTPPLRPKAEVLAVQQALLALDGIDWYGSETALRALPAALRAQVRACLDARGPAPGWD
jgi:hypothetical protein